MSDGPKRLLDDPDTVDPRLAARLRSDLRIARDASAGYDVEGGLARLAAGIAAGPPGGGHGGGGSGQAAPGTGSGAGNVAGSSAAGTSGALGVKAGLVGLVALGALGAALVAGSANKAPSSASSAIATITPPVPIAPSTPSSLEAPSAVAPSAVDTDGIRSSGGAPAAGPRSAASPAPPAGPTVKPEMDQLAEIRKALGSTPERALALAEEGHARFPRGVFWQEREVAAIGALSKLGRSGEAKTRARAFVARHPESLYAEGLRRLAEGD